MKSGIRLETVAKILVINQNRQALILTVGEYKERPEKSFTPDLPGGFVELNESEREAACREAREECGINLNSNNIRLGYAETNYFAKEKKSITKLLYFTQLDHTPTVTISWEHASYEWIALDELCQKVSFRPFYKEGVEYIVNNQLVR